MLPMAHAIIALITSASTTPSFTSTRGVSWSHLISMIRRLILWLWATHMTR